VNLAVTVQRTGGSKGVFSVDYTTTVDTATAPADFTETSGTLTWLDGEMGPKSITIPLEDDGDRENAERFLILLSGSSGPLSLDKTTVEIEDNDPATPPPPAPQNVERGGSGGLGIETLLMLGSICALAVRRRFATGRQPLH
jgi:hypothetical protein